MLFTKEKIHRGNKGGTTYSYEIYAVLKDNSRKKLACSLQKPEEALYLEQLIEKELKIEDEPVHGEFPRT